MNKDKKFGKRMDAKKLLEYTGIGKKDSKTHKHCPHPMKKKRSSTKGKDNLYLGY